MVQNKLPLINSAHGSETRNIINELIKLFNGMGYTYDEALSKAHDVLKEARQTNDANKNVQEQINTLIAESGTSDAEVLQARIDSRGMAHDVLNGRLSFYESLIDDLPVSLRGFGLEVDSNNDVTSTLQSILNSLPERSTVVIPDGTYIINTKINITKPIKIILSEKTVLKSGNTGSVRNTDGIFNIKSNDVTIIGGLFDVNNCDMRGIHYLESDNIRLENIKIINSGMSGLWGSQTNNIIIKNIELENCMNNEGYGDNRAGSARFNSCKNISVDGIHFKESHGKGVSLESCESFFIQNIHGTRTYYEMPGLYFNSSKNGTVTLSSFEEMDYNAIKYSRGCEDITVTNSIFKSRKLGVGENSKGYLLMVQGATRCSFKDNMLESHSSSEMMRIEDHPDPYGADTSFIDISGNTIKSFNTDIEVDNVQIFSRSDSDYLVSEINLSHNTFYEGNGFLNTISVDGVKATNNEIYNISGIAVRITSGTVLKDVKINNNKFIDIKGQLLSLHNTDTVCFDNNIVTVGENSESVTNAILLSSKCINTSISMNKISGYTGTFIRSSPSSSLINISLNTFIGSGSEARALYLFSSDNKLVANDYSNIKTRITLSQDSKNTMTIGEYPDEGGVVKFSGDGSTRTFSIPHNFGFPPSIYNVSANNHVAGNARVSHFVASSNSISVTFGVAPEAGVDNVHVMWSAER